MVDCEALSGVCCVILLPFILQAVGLFSPNWVSDSECDSHGLIYSCCRGSDNNTCANAYGGDELDVRVLGLEATACAMMFLALFGMGWASCCSSDDDDDDATGCCGALGGCCLFLLPVEGLFSFIGCMIIAANYSTSELGWSFYLCLTSGCYIILLTIILCCVICKIVKDEDSDGPSSRQADRTSDGVVPYEGQGGVAPYGGSGVAMAQYEERGVIHDPESGGFAYYMRRINIAHVVHTFRHSDD